MKLSFLAAHLLSFAFSFSAQAADSPKIGLLKCQAPDAERQLFHAFYFSQRKKEWVGENVTYDLTLPSIIEARKKAKEPPKKEVQATFDGKIISSLRVPLREERIPSVSPQVEAKCLWLKQHKRQEIILTTNQRKFSDPGRWRPSSLERLQVNKADLEERTSSYEKCERVSKASESLVVHQFVVGRIYESEGEKKALIELKSRCKELGDEALDSWDNSSKKPWSIWLFRGPSGEWKKNQNLDLIDIGDFDGDGLSEAVFFAGYPVPQGEFALIDLATFSKVTLAHEY